MGLFDKLKSLVSEEKKGSGTIDIVAPLSGEIVNIEDVPDVVFAEKIVGDGIAIKPAGHKIVAPVDGTIGKIFETNHAFSIAQPISPPQSEPVGLPRKQTVQLSAVRTSDTHPVKPRILCFSSRHSFYGRRNVTVRP